MSEAFFVPRSARAVTTAGHGPAERMTRLESVGPLAA
jgi:hypothetical protein